MAMISASFHLMLSKSQRQCARYIQSLLFSIIITGVFIIQPVSASSQYCDSSTVRSHIGLSYGNLEKSQLDTGTGEEVEITTNEVKFGWLKTNDATHSIMVNFDMLYTIIDFDGITPMTNGHLHIWDLSVNGNYKSNKSEVFYNITPALSVSSNILKNPDLINSDSLQLKTALVYKTDRNRNHEWVIGAMSDHRFGDYLLYPVAGVCWQPAENWLLQLVLPDFNIRKTFSTGISLSLYVTPEGNQWHVFSKDRQRNSDFTYNAIVTGITAQWAITPTTVLRIDVNKHTKREFSFVLDDNTSTELEAGSSRGIAVMGEVLF